MGRSILGLLLWMSIAMPAPAADFDERLVVIVNGEQAGYLNATTRADRIEVDYHVDDNGRGSKTKETIVLGPDGLPHAWSVKGAAWYGAPIDESFDWHGDTAQWKTLNDQGSAPGAAARLYIANDASPYALGVYLKALVAAPEQTLAGWPAGSVRAERIRDVRIRSASGEQTATVWALWGLDVTPTFILADASQHFRGYLSSFLLVVPQEWAGATGELKELAHSLDKETLREFTRKTVHRWDAPIYLRNVRVLDPDSGALSAPTTVVSFRGVITAIGADMTPPPEAVAIDGEGGTVLPSLFDVHVHLSPWDGPLHVAAGATTVRDMGNDNLPLLELTQEIDAGGVLGPRVIRSGFLEGRSPYSAHTGFVVDNLEDGLKAVRWYAAHGYWQLKIYNSAHPDWVQPLAKEAHRLGMRVAGHVPAFSSSERVVRDGYDEVTHINQLLLGFMIDTDKEDTRTPFRFTALGERTGQLDLHGAPFQRMIRLMQERGTAHDTTLAAFYGMLLARPGQLSPTSAPWADHMPGPLQRGLKVATLDMKPDQDGAYRASAQRLLDAVKLLHDSGIRILPGTDDFPGMMLHSELETWQRAGIAPAEVLRIATLGCAKYFALDQQLGTIERGKRADLLLVPGDPTRDVGLLRQARLVMKDGAVIFPDEIHSAMQIKPFSTRPPLVLPTK
jgi:amidohydrolase family protein